MALVGALEQIVPAGPIGMGRGTGSRVEELEASLGHVLADRSLLERALTHVSAAPAKHRGDANQRLEFLGDRVLGLAVSELLYEMFPDAEEGELSHRLSDLVRKETCAEVARGWGVGAHLRLGGGEGRDGGREKTAILGDACEAIIGALFLDAGYQAARDLVRRGFAGRMIEPPRPLRDAKTILQEWAQARGKPPPVYREISRGGPDHAPLFIIGVEVEGFSAVKGEGASKRVGEQAAATAFLERENVPRVAPEPQGHNNE